MVPRTKYCQRVLGGRCSEESYIWVHVYVYMCSLRRAMGHVVFMKPGCSVFLSPSHAYTCPIALSELTFCETTVSCLNFRLLQQRLAWTVQQWITLPYLKWSIIPLVSANGCYYILFGGVLFSYSWIETALPKKSFMTHNLPSASRLSRSCKGFLITVHPSSSFVSRQQLWFQGSSHIIIIFLTNAQWPNTQI